SLDARDVVQGGVRARGSPDGRVRPTPRGRGTRRPRRILGAPGRLDARDSVLAVRERLHSHLQARAVTHAIYQTVIVLAIVVSLERHPPSDGTLIVYVIGGAIAVGLADLYAGVVGRMIRERQPATRRAVRDDAVSILEGILVAIAVPIFFFSLHRLGVLAT